MKIQKDQSIEIVSTDGVTGTTQPHECISGESPQVFIESQAVETADVNHGAITPLTSGATVMFTCCSAASAQASSESAGEPTTEEDEDAVSNAYYYSVANKQDTISASSSSEPSRVP
ncbi:unnamed protein product [Orchesella dallaii]|uniref:Uncharacterized protein n=1 Tax=Orchesella dallaii TaxID=48710 RepID=A0ABP1RNR4_9HEXA